MNIGIIDYGAGNVLSVFNSLYRLGYNPKIIENFNNIKEQDKLIIPGVGSAKKCIENLKEKKFEDAIIEFYEKKKPILGICLGLQIFCKKLYENGISEGLNIIDAEVIPFKETLKTNMGWSNVSLEDLDKKKFNCKKDTSFYFCHSFYLNFNDKKDFKTYNLEINNYNIPAIIEKDNFLGAQFHPEKSQTNGIGFLNYFLKKI